ncbi:MAG: STAS domain-containing protein [Acidobacteriaceae bacterium]|nr:STAS domain-containing protein [Acidobacteriaceae bacterium]
MPLELHQREVEGITILSLRGRLVAGSSAEVSERFDALLAEGVRNLIGDLADVSHIDSTGLGLLVRGHSIMKAAGGAFKLLNLSQRSAQLLVLTKLSTVFEIFDDEQAAINSFFPERDVKRFDILEFVKSQENQNQQSSDSGADKNEPL